MGTHGKMGRKNKRSKWSTNILHGAGLLGSGTTPELPSSSSIMPEERQVYRLYCSKTDHYLKQLQSSEHRSDVHKGEGLCEVSALGSAKCHFKTTCKQFISTHLDAHHAVNIKHVQTTGLLPEKMMYSI